MDDSAFLGFQQVVFGLSMLWIAYLSRSVRSDIVRARLLAEATVRAVGEWEKAFAEKVKQYEELLTKLAAENGEEAPEFTPPPKRIVN